MLYFFNFLLISLTLTAGLITATDTPEEDLRALMFSTCLVKQGLADLVKIGLDENNGITIITGDLSKEQKEVMFSSIFGCHNLICRSLLLSITLRQTGIDNIIHKTRIDDVDTIRNYICGVARDALDFKKLDQFKGKNQVCQCR